MFTTKYLGVGVADGVHHSREWVDTSNAEVPTPDFEGIDIENIWQDKKCQVENHSKL